MLQMHDQVAFFQIREINVQRRARGLRVGIFLAAWTLDFVTAKDFRIGDNDDFHLIANKSTRKRADLNFQFFFRAKTVFLPDFLEALPLAVVVAKTWTEKSCRNQR